MNVAQATSSAMLNEVFTLLNGGTITIYSGTMPATPETALSGNTALVSGTFTNPALSGSIAYSGGYMVGNLGFADTTLGTITSGTAVWARALSSASAAVVDLTVGTSGTDVIVGNTSIQTGVTVNVTSATLSNPAS